MVSESCQPLDQLFATNKYMHDPDDPFPGVYGYTWRPSGNGVYIVIKRSKIPINIINILKIVIDNQFMVVFNIRTINHIT